MSMKNVKQSAKKYRFQAGYGECGGWNHLADDSDCDSYLYSNPRIKADADCNSDFSSYFYLSEKELV